VDEFNYNILKGSNTVAYQCRCEVADYKYSNNENDKFYIRVFFLKALQDSDNENVFSKATLMKSQKEQNKCFLIKANGKTQQEEDTAEENRKLIQNHDLIKSLYKSNVISHKENQSIKSSNLTKSKNRHSPTAEKTDEDTDDKSPILSSMELLLPIDETMLLVKLENTPKKESLKLPSGHSMGSIPVIEVLPHEIADNEIKPDLSDAKTFAERQRASRVIEEDKKEEIRSVVSSVESESKLASELKGRIYKDIKLSSLRTSGLMTIAFLTGIFIVEKLVYWQAMDELEDYILSMSYSSGIFDELFHLSLSLHEIELVENVGMIYNSTETKSQRLNELNKMVLNLQNMSMLLSNASWRHKNDIKEEVMNPIVTFYTFDKNNLTVHFWNMVSIFETIFTFIYYNYHGNNITNQLPSEVYTIKHNIFQPILNVFNSTRNTFYNTTVYKLNKEQNISIIIFTLFVAALIIFTSINIGLLTHHLKLSRRMLSMFKLLPKSMLKEEISVCKEFVHTLHSEEESIKISHKEIQNIKNNKNEESEISPQTGRALIQNENQTKLLEIKYRAYIYPIIISALIWMAMEMECFIGIISNFSGIQMICNEMSHISLTLPYANIMYYMLLRIINGEKFQAININAINYLSTTLAEMYIGEEKFQKAFKVAKNFHTSDYISLYNKMITGNLCDGIVNSTNCSLFSDGILTKGLSITSIRYYDAINLIFKSYLTQPGRIDMNREDISELKQMQSHYLPLLYSTLGAELRKDLNKK
jgi:hypothetical protein